LYGFENRMQYTTSVVMTPDFIEWRFVSIIGTGERVYSIFPIVGGNGSPVVGAALGDPKNAHELVTYRLVSINLKVFYSKDTLDLEWWTKIGSISFRPNLRLGPGSFAQLVSRPEIPGGFLYTGTWLFTRDFTTFVDAKVPIELMFETDRIRFAGNKFLLLGEEGAIFHSTEGDLLLILKLCRNQLGTSSRGD
jgi:hypothetical protein